MNMMDWVGQTLGQYRIEAPLGAGGMGQVFRGMHMYLNRPVAVKVMQANFAADPTFQARFLQEAKAAATLKHPNIVEIYDFNEQDGTFYLVMGLMTDGSLRTLLRQRTSGQPWPLSLGLDLVRQAAEGLAAAHAKGMVHRDIKPDNLLLNRLSPAGQEPGRYQLKISDFGLAHMAAGGGLTATGVPMGTLAYMSPEQCQAGKLDGRSDLYSLGVVLYEVATGSLPFQIDNFTDAFNKHIYTPPPPPRQVRPDLPPVIEEIILRCLAKKPQERYATGTELAQALQRVLGDGGLETMTPLHLPPVPSALVKSTVLESPGAGGTPPPVVSTLLRPSSVPRLRVLDQGGQTLQVAEVTSYGLIIGRQPGNDIVLEAQGVSRQHLRVKWDGRQVTVIDLGSSNGSWLGNQRLQPQISQAWTERQAIRIGPFWLRLEAPNPAVAQSMSGGLSQTMGYDAVITRQMQGTAAMWGSGRIGMLVEPGTLTITPGQPAMVKATLVNQGSIVDWLTVTVEGVTPEWVRGPSQEVQLNPGMQETVELSVNVARTASNLANDYPVTIRARSREKPDESGTARALWTVLPFKEDTLRIEPRRASGRGSAAYTIALQNGGNTPARHELSGEDDEQKIEYHFGANPVALEPGREAKVPLTVKLRRHWIGREQRQPFQIHARPAGSSNPLIASGEFVNKPLIPAWVLPVVGVVLAAAVALGALFHVPPFPGQPGLTPTPAPTITSQPTIDTQATAIAQANATATGAAQTTANATATGAAQTTANATATGAAQANATATVNASLREINNNDPGISYTGSCYYNHGLSSSLYNDDVEICKQQNDSFTYTFTGTSIYLVTVYYQNHGGTISCYIDGSFTHSYNLDSSNGVDNYGLAYGIVLPIAPQLTFSQHTASCTMTSASGTFFFVDALIINK